MKTIIYLIIIGAAGYLGYNYYMEKHGGAAVSSETDTSSAPTEEVRKLPSGSTPPSPAPATTASRPAPQPFKSRIVIPTGAPGEKHLAKPGVYYVLDRASTEHDAGIAAVVPGEEVRIVTKKGNGTVKVSNGKYEFEVKESQITNDLDVAQAAERKFMLSHPPARQ